jgi:hypothetical protein
MDAFTNKSHKTKYFEDINYNKIVTLEVRVRVIKGVDLYDLVQATKMRLVLNVVEQNISVCLSS